MCCDVVFCCEVIFGGEFIFGCDVLVEIFDIKDDFASNTVFDTDDDPESVDSELLVMMEPTPLSSSLWMLLVWLSYCAGLL